MVSMFLRFRFIFGLVLFSASARAVIPTIHCASEARRISVGGTIPDSMEFEVGIDNYRVVIEQRSVPGSLMEKLAQRQADHQMYRLNLEFEKVRDEFRNLRPSCLFNRSSALLFQCSYIPKFVKAHLTQLQDPNRLPSPELLDREVEVPMLSLATQKVVREFISNDGEGIENEEVLRLVVSWMEKGLTFPSQFEVNYPLAVCAAVELPETPAN